MEAEVSALRICLSSHIGCYERLSESLALEAGCCFGVSLLVAEEDAICGIYMSWKI
jgi:hypothetical protein